MASLGVYVFFRPNRRFFESAAAIANCSPVASGPSTPEKRTAR